MIQNLLAWFKFLFHAKQSPPQAIAKTFASAIATGPQSPATPLFSAFDEAFKYLLIDEGTNYENVPGDSGGPTKFGITIHDLTEYLGRDATIDEVKNMTMETARDIYKRKYWNPMCLGLIQDPRVAIALFDIGVVCGIGTAAHLAQEALKIPITMKMDISTIRAINQTPRATFIGEFEKMDEQRFEHIAALHEQDVKFLKGWLNRARRLLTLVA